MSLLDIINELERRGIQIESHAGKLTLKAPEGAMTPELLERVKDNKPELIAMLNGHQTASSVVRQKIDKSGKLPLSFAQERIWFLMQLEPDSAAAYNVVAPIRMRGHLNPDFLQQALNTVIARHETLRTRFENIEGKPAQVITPMLEVEISPIQLSDLSGENQEQQLNKLIAEEAALPFDLSFLPLMRTQLIDCGNNEWVFILVMHHIITDDWSSGVLIEEIANSYQALSTGAALTLPELDFQFADYVAWQAEWMESPSYQKALKYWTERLEGTPVLNLGTDHPRSAVQSFAGASHYVHYPLALSERLQALAKSHEVTLYSLLLTAFKVLLHRYTGQDDIAVGSPISNRKLRETEGLIGFFTNTVVYRTTVLSQATFSDLLRDLNQQVRDSQDYQDMPFEKLVEALSPERNMGVNPLFQVCFSMLHAYRDELRLGDLELQRLDHSSPTARFDFTVMVEDTRDGLRVDVEYCTALFDTSTVKRFLAHYQTLLEGIVANPDARLFELPLATTAEQEQTLVHWNQTQTNYPATQCVHQLFEAMAQAHPDAVALVSGQEQMSYAVLNEQANQLAHELRGFGVGPDVGVAVCARRSIPMIVSLIGTLKAGGYYLPFDEADPTERLRGLFEAAKVQAILAPQTVLERMPEDSVHTLAWECMEVELAQQGKENLNNLNDPRNLAYVTFTSGSTGKPKGIMIPHHGVVRLVRDTNYMEYHAGLTILELAPVSFDASTFELWGALCNGARMVIMPPEKPSIQSLSEHIEQHNITSMYLTSAMFNLMVEEKLDALCQLKELLVGGDTISVSHAKRLLAADSGVTLINGYGPTEATTFAGCHNMRKPEDVGYTVSIGKSISNTTLYVLDEYYNAQPIGVPGDLYIGGDGNARGYLNLPAMTAECFVPNPYGEPGSLIYRTGDLARFAEDGTLELLGRRDNQVKVRGFRIELGDIENNICMHAAVKEVAVISKDEGLGSKQLIGFYQLNTGQQIEEATLRDFLAQTLPDYMIPSALVQVDSFKLNAHNKIDRKALYLLWDETATQSVEDYIAPVNEVEEVIAFIWSQVLQVERISVEANFFQIGGHSLLATKVIWKLFEVFAQEIPLKTLFLCPTVRMLAQELESKEVQAGRTLAVAKIYLKLSKLSPEEIEKLLKAKRARVEQ